MFNRNSAIGDLDGDGAGELVVPSDVHYVCAYESDGEQIAANPMYGDKDWGKVGVHVNHAVDLRGYAYCTTEHRPNSAHSPATIADMDRGGIPEVIVVGNAYNCGASSYTSLYEMSFIFNGDRSCWTGNSSDRTEISIPDVAASPLTEDYNVIENNQPNPVAADLDGDSYLVVLSSSYDGRVHAFWLDKAEHGSWPRSVHSHAEGIYRFASEPAVADLDGDGRAEVIFTSWAQRGSYQAGRLHILDYQGNALHETDLPAARSGSWNGALPAPTLGDIDGDADLEVVLNTAHSGLVAYDLPGTAEARILWGTGRVTFSALDRPFAATSTGRTRTLPPPSPGPLTP